MKDQGLTVIKLRCDKLYSMTIDVYHMHILILKINVSSCSNKASPSIYLTEKRSKENKY